MSFRAPLKTIQTPATHLPFRPLCSTFCAQIEARARELRGHPSGPVAAYRPIHGMEHPLERRYDPGFLRFACSTTDGEVIPMDLKVFRYTDGEVFWELRRFVAIFTRTLN